MSILPTSASDLVPTFQPIAKCLEQNAFPTFLPTSSDLPAFSQAVDPKGISDLPTSEYSPNGLYRAPPREGGARRPVGWPDLQSFTASDWRDHFEERAGIHEFDGRKPRDMAEAQAWSETVTAYALAHQVGPTRAEHALTTLFAPFGGLGPTRSAAVVHDSLHGLGQGRGEPSRANHETTHQTFGG